MPTDEAQAGSLLAFYGAAVVWGLLTFVVVYGVDFFGPVFDPTMMMVAYVVGVFLPFPVALVAGLEIRAWDNGSRGRS